MRADSYKPRSMAGAAGWRAGEQPGVSFMVDQTSPEVPPGAPVPPETTFSGPADSTSPGGSDSVSAVGSGVGTEPTPPQPSNVPGDAPAPAPDLNPPGPPAGDQAQTAPVQTGSSNAAGSAPTTATLPPGAGAVADQPDSGVGALPQAQLEAAQRQGMVDADVNAIVSALEASGVDMEAFLRRVKGDQPTSAIDQLRAEMAKDMQKCETCGKPDGLRLFSRDDGTPYAVCIYDGTEQEFKHPNPAGS